MAKNQPQTRSRIDLVHEVITLIYQIVAIYLQSLLYLIIGKPEKDLNGQIVVITGAGHGLGRELALELSQLKCKIALLDVNLANCQKVENEINCAGKLSKSYRCDVTNKEMVSKVFKLIEKDLGKVDILINNAGITHCKPFSQLNAEQIYKTFNVNTFSHFWTIHEVLPNMIKTGSGHIVAISSIAGLIGTANCVDYCASKFAIVGIMESLDKEVHADEKNSQIHLTTICPLIMNTGMFQFPKTRFSSIFPICTANYSAKQVIKAIRCNDSLITIPRSAIIFHRLSK